MAGSNGEWAEYIEIPLEPAIKTRVMSSLETEKQQLFLRRKHRRAMRQFGQKHKFEHYE